MLMLLTPTCGQVLFSIVERPLLRDCSVGSYLKRILVPARRHMNPSAHLMMMMMKMLILVQEELLALS